MFWCFFCQITFYSLQNYGLTERKKTFCKKILRDFEGSSRSHHGFHDSWVRPKNILFWCFSIVLSYCHLTIFLVYFEKSFFSIKLLLSWALIINQSLVTERKLKTLQFWRFFSFHMSNSRKAQEEQFFKSMLQSFPGASSACVTHQFWEVGSWNPSIFNKTDKFTVWKWRSATLDQICTKLWSNFALISYHSRYFLLFQWGNNFHEGCCKKFKNPLIKTADEAPGF